MIEDEGWPRRVVELPADVRKTWGALDEKLYDLFPDAGDFEEGGKTALSFDTLRYSSKLYVIIANRFNEEALGDVLEMVYTRNLFQRDYLW